MPRMRLGPRVAVGIMPQSFLWVLVAMYVLLLTSCRWFFRPHAL